MFRVIESTRDRSPVPVPVTTEPARARRLLAPSTAFAGSGAVFAALYVAAGAPTPLLVVFEQQWRFPAWVLTVAFASYALGLLAALLVAGSLSDHIGRRPVLIGSLAVELGAMLMFVFASDIGWVIAARTIQGIATGAATSAFSASVVEHAPQHRKKLGTIITSVAPAGGLGLGALLTGAAVQFSNHASVIVFTALAVIMAVGTGVVAFSAETVSPRPGAVRSLTPHVSVPGAARREFVASIPVHMAAWMLAGLFMGLVPTIIRDLLGLHSGLLNGATAFVQPAAAAVAGLSLGRLAPRRTIFVGGAGVLLGTAVNMTGVATATLPLLWLGGLIGGVGFGASFSGALRTITPLAQPHQRAGLFAAVYLVAYLSFGVPAIIAGLLIAPLGLLHTVLGYGVVVIAAAALGLLAQYRMHTRR
ncbi:major facilitator transporter [Streptomyces bingchenggensis BCW-1]|uniref:Major facilitator transporter n=1 Tax=Streptomyces bingchenggensis (strain BCW-1) TaxID=749414 RepID=D7C5Q6_STRBB|nr:major facilitator transporter [Streptomyces bingchenggensis BCW-1]